MPSSPHHFIIILSALYLFFIAGTEGNPNSKAVEDYAAKGWPYIFAKDILSALHAKKRAATDPVKTVGNFLRETEDGFKKKIKNDKQNAFTNTFRLGALTDAADVARRLVEDSGIGLREQLSAVELKKINDACKELTKEMREFDQQEYEKLKKGDIKCGCIAKQTCGKSGHECLHAIYTHELLEEEEYDLTKTVAYSSFDE